MISWTGNWEYDRNKHINTAWYPNVRHFQTQSSPGLTWVFPGLTEADFVPILSHWRCEYFVGVSTRFHHDIAVFTASSCGAVVLCSRLVPLHELHYVVLLLRAQRAPVHPEGVVGLVIEPDVCWTTGTYRREFWEDEIVVVFTSRTILVV